MNIVDYISPGKQNAVTREQLRLRTGLSDRKMRKLIAKAWKDGIPILNDQDGAGYYLSEEPGELKRQYQANMSRALSILEQNTHLRRRIKKLEEGGGPMPNRILKETICTSDSIDGLSWFEEVLFYRLIVNCDDYGRFDGRPAIIKNRLFPLKETLTAKSVSGAINKLASAGLVTLYVFEGKPYLYLPTWNHHQVTRAQRSKYPAPESGDLNLQADEIICKQVKADVPVFVFDNRESRIDNRETNDSAEPPRDSTPPVITLTLNDGTEYPVSQEQCHEWAGLYPAVDVIQQLRQMKAWLDANPTRRKTKRGINAFVVNWLSKEQNRGGNRAKKKETAGFVYDYGDMEGCL